LFFFLRRKKNFFYFRYNYVAGGEDGKGFVETVKEKAGEAYVFISYIFFLINFYNFRYNFVAEKVSEVTHAVTGEHNKEVAKDSNETVGTRAGAAVDAVKDKAQETASSVKAEAHKQNL
jgi:hypothetical protein